VTTLLTIPEVAARLRCGKSSVYNLISIGELATTDIAIKGDRPKTRVSEQAVEDFIAARTTDRPRRTA
jgi:excisionase family DNA binding protein